MVIQSFSRVIYSKSAIVLQVNYSRMLSKDSTLPWLLSSSTVHISALFKTECREKIDQQLVHS